MQDHWFKIRKEGLDMLDADNNGLAMGISMAEKNPVPAGISSVALGTDRMLINLMHAEGNTWSHKLAGVFIANDIAFKMLPAINKDRESTFEVTGNKAQLKKAWKRLISHLDYFDREGGKKG